MPARLLAGYDGSDAARLALRAAGPLLGGGEALVVHVRPALPGFAGSREAIEAASARLGEEVGSEGAELAAAAGFRAEPLAVVDERPVWAVLAELAEARGVDLVLLGASRPHGPARLLTSTADRLAHVVTRPLLVVPAPPGEGPLLLCVDGSEGAERAVATAARRFASRPATVLSVWESSASFVLRHARGGEIAGLVEDVAAELDRDLAARAAEVAAAGAAAAGAHGLPAEPLARRAIAGALERDETTVWETIVAVAGELDASAIVVGTRGQSAWRALAAGSVSRGVLHHADRPVLLVP